jgi:hypothetical protein
MAPEAIGANNSWLQPFCDRQPIAEKFDFWQDIDAKNGLIIHLDAMSPDRAAPGGGANPIRRDRALRMA